MNTHKVVTWKRSVTFAHTYSQNYAPGHSSYTLWMAKYGIFQEGTVIASLIISIVAVI